MLVPLARMKYDHTLYGVVTLSNQHSFIDVLNVCEIVDEIPYARAHRPTAFPFAAYKQQL